MDLKRLLQPLSRRLALVIGRGVVTRVDDSPKMQSLQVQLFDGVVLDGVERFQNYGFSAVPQLDAEAVVLSLAGNRSHTIAIMVDDRRYRLKNLAPGEVALYTDEGDKIHLKRGGTIAVQAATKLEITAPQVTMSGNLAVTGTVSAATVSDSVGSMAALRTGVNAHGHVDPQGGSVGPSLPAI